MSDPVTVGLANLTEMVVHEFREAFQKYSAKITPLPEDQRPKAPFVQMAMPDFGQTDEELRLRYAVPAGGALAVRALDMGASLSAFRIECSEDGPPTMPVIFRFYATNA